MLTPSTHRRFCQPVRAKEEVSNPNPSRCKLLTELKDNDEHRQSNYILQIHIYN